MEKSSEFNSSRDDSRSSRGFEDEMRQRGFSMLRSGKDSIAEEFGKIGSAIHVAARHLQEDKDPLGTYADNIAGNVDNLSAMLRDKSPQDAYDMFKEFSHRRPALALSGLFAAGFALSRFLKAGRPSE